MSPDEAMVTISYAAADRARAELDNLLSDDSRPFRAGAEAMLRRYADEIRAACAAHRASGEGGSTSALRASAPEGFIRRELFDNACIERDGLEQERDEHYDTIQRLRETLGQIADHAGEVHYGTLRVWATAALSPPQAVAKAHLARAAHSLAPEGTDARTVSLPLDLARDVLAVLLDLGACEDPKCKEAACVHALPRFRKAMRDSERAWPTTAPQAQARTPSAASAASAPEGIDAVRWDRDCDRDYALGALWAGIEALTCARGRLPQYMVASMIDPARDALRQAFTLRKDAIREGAAMSPDEGIDWGPYAFDVWVDGSISPIPVARFQYGTDAGAWANAHYPNRTTLRAVPRPPQAVKVAESAATQPTPEGQSPAHEMGYALTCAERERDNLRESWIAARQCIREIKAAVAVKRDHEILWQILTCYDQRNHEPAASVEAGPSRGAAAPLAPEGQGAVEHLRQREIAGRRSSVEDLTAAHLVDAASPRQQAVALKVAVRCMRMLDESDARRGEDICRGIDELVALAEGRVL